MATLSNNTIIMPPECVFFLHWGSDNNKYCVMVSDDARSVLMLHVAAKRTRIFQIKLTVNTDGRAKKTGKHIIWDVRCCLGCEHASPWSCCEEATSGIRRGTNRTFDIISTRDGERERKMLTVQRGEQLSFHRSILALSHPSTFCSRDSPWLPLTHPRRNTASGCSCLFSPQRGAVGPVGSSPQRKLECSDLNII